MTMKQPTIYDQNIHYFTIFQKDLQNSSACMLALMFVRSLCVHLGTVVDQSLDWNSLPNKPNQSSTL